MEVKGEIVSPAPSAMFESMRAYGYSLPVAVADLIDNSISANASNVWLDFHWNGPSSRISVADDGDGMSEEALVSAMRLGSQNPLEERAINDLGRFGLGMKTASFSQCRSLTVKSKREGKESIRRWDLDYIAERARKGDDRWILLRDASKDAKKSLVIPNELSSGTIVLWERVDRVTGNAPVSDAKAHRTFLQSVNGVHEYLAMVFHRFLEGRRPQLKIFINGKKQGDRICPWDPFLESHPCTQSTPKEPISVNGGTVHVRGFILPHKNKMEPDEHSDAAGPAGWNAQQGFYVYRNKRLLVAGSWLQLDRSKPWTQEEHYKLARIQLDIPNSMDQAWKIDVKKSVAVPPPEVRTRLQELAQEIRQRARQVFAHKGKYGPHAPKKEVVHPWICSNPNGRPVYRLDRNHPLVLEAMRLADSRKEVIEALLGIIEETVPVQQIWLDTAEKPDSHSHPFSDRAKKDVRRLVRCTYESLLSHGKSPEEARKDLLLREEFSEYSDLINEL